MKYEKLFTPIKIGNVEIKNRICMAPMLMGFGQIDGKATDQLMDYYEERAKGGTGLIFTEITRVNDRTGGSAFKQLGMSHDYQIEKMSELAGRIHKHGSKIFVQLHHPGRQNMALLMDTLPMSILGEKLIPRFEDMLYSVVPAGKILMKYHIVPRVVSPSKCENVYFADGNNRALRKSEIKALVKDFVNGAVRVKKAGCDGVQLHASHGYLLQQFLSPHTNRRTDEYGGSLENRMRFLLEIIEGIRKECGKDFPIIVRLTVDECYGYIGHPGRGYRLNDGIRMAKRLEEAGVDAIDVSSGGYDAFNYWLEPTSFECGWRKFMAAAVKNAVSIPVIAANLIRSPEQAEAQLQEGTQDMISLGRPHIADPHWAEKVMEGRSEDVKRCICCLYCIESMQNNAYTGGHGHCAVNPFVGRESYKLNENG
ncbi:MAG: NADH:flavin oxidoreductase, partial [Clostridia bacterium]|nr:NADH:flavin oxidoreductase [Clostridia bacterium]